MNPPILVFGSSGQLAQELARTATESAPVILVGRDRCDLAAGGDPQPWIESLAPAFVVNAAAYTAVDRAESEPQAAYALNRDAPARIAHACAARGTPFLHVSTDYVFDGTEGAPYTEGHSRAPLGVYGGSKAAGEDAVAQAGGRSAIVRVAWLYSAFGSNFPKTMLRLAQNREEISVVDDQIGRPTSAALLAQTLRLLGPRLLGDNPVGHELFHLAPRGQASWADFAEAVFARSAARGGPTARVKHIATADYPTAARRPADSRLDPTKLETFLNTRFPDWREPLDALVAELVPSTERVGA